MILPSAFKDAERSIDYIKDEVSFGRSTFNRPFFVQLKKDHPNLRIAHRVIFGPVTRLAIIAVALSLLISSYVTTGTMSIVSGGFLINFSALAFLYTINIFSLKAAVYHWGIKDEKRDNLLDAIVVREDAIAKVKMKYEITNKTLSELNSDTLPTLTTVEIHQAQEALQEKYQQEYLIAPSDAQKKQIAELKWHQRFFNRYLPAKLGRAILKDLPEFILPFITAGVAAYAAYMNGGLGWQYILLAVFALTVSLGHLILGSSFIPAAFKADRELKKQLLLENFYSSEKTQGKSEEISNITALLPANANIIEKLGAVLIAKNIEYMAIVDKFNNLEGKIEQLREKQIIQKQIIQEQKKSEFKELKYRIKNLPPLVIRTKTTFNNDADKKPESEPNLRKLVLMRRRHSLPETTNNDAGDNLFISTPTTTATPTTPTGSMGVNYLETPTSPTNIGIANSPITIEENRLSLPNALFATTEPIETKNKPQVNVAEKNVTQSLKPSSVEKSVENSLAIKEKLVIKIDALHKKHVEELQKNVQEIYPSFAGEGSNINAQINAYVDQEIQQNPTNSKISNFVQDAAWAIRVSLGKEIGSKRDKAADSSKFLGEVQKQDITARHKWAMDIVSNINMSGISR